MVRSSQACRKLCRGHLDDRMSPNCRARAKMLAGLAVALERERVVPLPSSAPGWAQFACTMVSSTETAALTASGSKTTQFAVFVHRITEPVNAWILTDALVMWIHHDTLVILVKRILCDPVRVQHAQTATGPATALFGLAAEIASPLVLIDAAIARLAVVNTLIQLLFAAATADAHAIDDEPLLCFVTQIACFVRAGWFRCTVDDWQLPVFPAPNTQQEANSIRLFLTPQLLQILECTLRHIPELDSETLEAKPAQMGT